MMKNILALFILFISFGAKAQIFWSENFGTSATSSVVASSYTGWSITVTGTEGGVNNQWYVSCMEAGQLAGVCGSDCATSFGLGPTLHLASAIGDVGASYLAGGAPYVTDRRANSPTINCTGRYGNTLAFYYIEAGEGADDDAEVWYYDGTTWSLLVNTPKTVVSSSCSGQGLWTRYTYSLPVSANNNPNVKIGFRWVNDADFSATDPSFAVDSISVSGSLSSATPVPSYTVTPALTVCAGGCLLFDNTTTGSIDSLRWSGAGGTIANPTSDTTTICFTTAGTHTMTLTVYKTGSPYTTTRVVTVNPAPAAITGSHTLCTTLSIPLSNATSGGTWSSAATSIATVGSATGVLTGVAVGSTTITYALSSGCYTTHTVTVYPLPCSVGMPEQTGKNVAAEIFPNPATDELVISIAQNAYDVYEITNGVGQSLLQAPLNTLQTKVDIKALTAGMYYIRLRGTGGSIVQRFVKE